MRYVVRSRRTGMWLRLINLHSRYYDWTCWQKLALSMSAAAAVEVTTQRDEWEVVCLQDLGVDIDNDSD